MSDHSIRVSIIGSALSGNKGAAAMLESAIDTLSERIPGVQFTLFSMYPAEDAARNSYRQLDIVPASPRQLGVTINLLALIYRCVPPLRKLLRRRSAAIRALTSSAVLLDQGGITFTDGREKFLLYNIASILPALMVGTPVFKCAQAIGPFRSPVNRWAARTFLPRVSQIVTRGRITHELASDLGLRNIVAGADYAFALELDGTEEAAVAAQFDVSTWASGRVVVGIAPSIVVARKVDGRGGDYTRQIRDFIDRLLEAGYVVTVVPHSVRTGTEKEHNNDLPLCRSIVEGLSDRSNVLFVDRELTSQQLRYVIGRCDLFVASRFHAMVSSLAMGVPTIVIGWSHKYLEVLEMFELQEWAFPHSSLEREFLWTRFEALVEQRDALEKRIARHLPDVKARATMQADLIAESVAGAQ